MTDVVINLVALLAVLCQVFVVGTLVFRLAAFSAAVRPAWDRWTVGLRPYLYALAFTVAVVTTAGSLYMSEVANFLPCKLCWIQRGFLYPEVLITGLLLVRPSWRWLRWVAVALAVCCVPVSIYHYLIEWFPTLEATSCDPRNPCNVRWFSNVFGYVSLPLMALSSALTIITAMLLAFFTDRRKTAHDQ